MGRPDLGAERERLLGFARGARVPGGFAWLDDDGRPEPRPPELWITTRMTHVFALGELLGEPDCAAFADHGLEAIATAFADADHGGWRAQAGVPGKAAYDHAFVLLAGASAAIAGRPGAAALLEQAAARDRRALLGRGRGRLPRVVGRRVAGARAVPRREREHAHGRGVPRRRRRHGRAALGGARPADRRAADRPRGASARAGASQSTSAPDWRPLPDYNADRPNDRFRPFGHTPGHALEWARLLLGLRAALPDPPDWLLEAPPALFDRALADGWDEGGFVYTTDGDGRRWCASGCTGSSPRRSAPPPRCTR